MDIHAQLLEVTLMDSKENQEDFKQLDNIVGVDEVIRLQKEKLQALRERVRDLEFKKIDIAGGYTSLSFKAIDGGQMNVHLNPFEITVIEVADSNDHRKISFLVPEMTGFDDNEKIGEEIIKQLDQIPIIKKFANLLNKKSIDDVSTILKRTDALREIAEWACIFERVTLDTDDPIVILKDGLLRPKVIKSEKEENYVGELKEILKHKKKYVKLIGVSKTSQVLSLLSVALHLEKKIPSNAIGYLKVPLDLESQAYNWTGSSRIKLGESKRLNYAFGDLFIAKLAKNGPLLVTIEIPRGKMNEEIYSEQEIDEIFSYLAKDSKLSYPILGYPQTIMKAHEAAVRLGFPASIIRDELKDKILLKVDKDTKEFIRDSWLLLSEVNKGTLGGGHYD